jgi:hypothetical protein
MILNVKKITGLKKSQKWKEVFFHEFNVIAEIGGEEESCVLSVGSKSEEPPTLVAGSVEVEAKPDYMGVKQFKLVKKPSFNGSGGGYTPRSGGGGGRPMENPSEKRAGVAMSYAVGLVNGGKAGVDKLYTLADDIYEWMCAKAK